MISYLIKYNKTLMIDKDFKKIELKHKAILL